ncbi:solute carrier family 12 member 1-like isoform X2 [Babylonia areolata]|uniref:solute carrier family 12 member 1-like isoform X2 n=1 Tax=Babylonia areolata TaxID=304850 RepID=UPI003FD24AAC
MESTGGTGEDITKSSSRFQVARVDSRRDSEDISVEINHESPQSGPGSPGGRRISVSTNSCTYDTSGKTNYDWNNLTEALPREAFYRNIFSTTPGLKSRPTLAELHEEIEDGDIRARNREPLLAAQGERELEEGATRPPEVEPTSTKSLIKFGWIKGVLIRCLLNIWGVMLFIRMSWCVGEAGILQMVGIITLSCIVTTITTLSMSAICTNGVVKGGGAYFMISRSLGPEFGGPIGLLFSLANAVAVAMYVVGFAETFVLQIMLPYTGLMTTAENDIRIIGAITLLILCGISVCGMEWETRAQMVLLTALLVALVSFFVGVFLPPTDYKAARGFTAFNMEVLQTNAFSDYRGDVNFAAVFSVFFPAATGILAGANISGDLKDPAKAIPKGTLIAILISTAVYIMVAILLGGSVLRVANGYEPLSEVLHTTVLPTLDNSTLSYLTTMFGPSSFNISTTTLVPSASTAQPYVYSMANVANCSLVEGGCKYGLFEDYKVMMIASAFGPLVTVGIFSATLSSALASLVSAPKVFQAVCQDKIFPKLDWFTQYPGRNGGVSWRCNCLVFFLGMVFTLIGDLNFIAPLISMFFLATYALINFSCFDVSMANTPGWRPGFRYYNKWVSLLGFVICIVVMFLISWPMALVCAFIICSLCMYLKHVKPNVNWGSSGQAHVYRKALKFALKLLRTEDHVKTYRPQVLVLTGQPDTRPILVDFVSHITKNVGLMVCGNVIVGKQSDNLRSLLSSDADHFFMARKARSFYNCTVATSFRLGVQCMMQNVGIGKFKPNVLIMGFKCNWSTDTAENVHQYFSILHDAFDLHYGVGILRVKEGLGSGMDEGDATIFNDPNDPSPPQTDDELDSSDLDQDNHEVEVVVPNGRYSKNGIGARRGGGDSSNKSSPRKRKKDMVVEIQEPKGGNAGAVNTDLVHAMNRFDVKKVPRGTIDIWWLYDDGGLTLLIPHLLRQRVWKKCQIRIFVPGSKKGDIDKTQRELVGMMKKFRLETKTVEVLPEVNKAPKPESIQMFTSALSPWLLDEEAGETQEEFPWKCSQSEVDLLADKTRRHLRVKELVMERSNEASLIVLTLPMPRKGTCSAGLYMIWLDILTRDLPPTLLLRGNQKSVLTFYS